MKSEVNNTKHLYFDDWHTFLCSLEQSLYCWSEWLEDGYRFFLLAEAHDAPKYVLVWIINTLT